MLIVAIFIVGYVAIVFEHTLRLNKAAAALLTGVLCWTAYVATGDPHTVNENLTHHLGQLSQVLFFLLAAMTIVGVIDAHDGFDVFTSRVATRSRRKLLATITVLSFLLSAILDNLTTSIVMMSLIRRLVPDEKDRMSFAGVVIISANAGGVWSPIGDVTTTMLWVGGQITTVKVVAHLLVPALVSVAVPVIWIGARMKGSVGGRPKSETRDAEPSISDAAAPGLPALTQVTLTASSNATGRTLAALDLRARTGAAVMTITRGEEVMSPSPLDPLRAGDVLALTGDADAVARANALLVTGVAPKATTSRERVLVLAAGVGVLLFVPAFKTITHLPPMMGILLGLGLLWTLVEVIHKEKPVEKKGALTVSGALQRVDTPTLLFFLGILLAITALESDGALERLAHWMDHTVHNADAVTVLIGLSSSIVDNVPLVAAAQGMYSMTEFPTDHRFWLFLAYCAGTGGSILIIGSAAGVAVMGLEKISFGWYFRRMSLPALLGFGAGAITYLLMGH